MFKSNGSSLNEWLDKVKSIAAESDIDESDINSEYQQFRDHYENDLSPDEAIMFYRESTISIDN